MESLYHKASLKLGITDSVSVILYTVYDMGDGCLLSDVYKFSGINKQIVDSAIRGLEADDILNLEKNTGKTKRIVMTDKGKALIEKTVARLHAAETAAFETWQDKEVADYLRLMDKYTECFHRQVDKLQ